MPITVTNFEETPNPNAVKCWIEPSAGPGPRSYRDSASASDDPIAAALFARAGATSVLIFGDWLTVNKAASDDWRTVKKRIQSALADVDAPASDRAS